MRSRAVLANVAGALVPLVAVAAVVTADRPKANVARVLPGHAVVSDSTNGVVIGVDAASGNKTYAYRVGQSGSPLVIHQRDGHVYVEVTEPSGRRVLYRLSDSGTQQAQTPFQVLSGQQRLVRGGSRAFLVDERAGTVQPIDPETLGKAPAAPGAKSSLISFDGPIAVAAGDDGSLVVVSLTRATVEVLVAEPVNLIV